MVSEDNKLFLVYIVASELREPVHRNETTQTASRALSHSAHIARETRHQQLCLWQQTNSVQKHQPTPRHRVGRGTKDSWEGTNERRIITKEPRALGRSKGLHIMLGISAARMKSPWGRRVVERLEEASEWRKKTEHRVLKRGK